MNMQLVTLEERVRVEKWQDYWSAIRIDSPKVESDGGLQILLN